MAKKNDSIIRGMIVALVMILAGAIIANIAHTSAGFVKIHDIKYVTEDGAEMRALLYVPKSASATNPAPVVISCHGYNNTAEVQDLNCVELSKRGFIVMAIDAYGHGGSTFPDERINPISADMGTYAALQYIGTLPYADSAKVGMVGHSMGGSTIQAGAAKAWQLKQTNPRIVVPTAVLPTSQSFSLDSEGNALLAPWPVNLGSVYGQFDEWALSMWGTVKGSDLNTSKIAQAGMGFTDFQYDTYYAYGGKVPLDRTAAVNAAKQGRLRIVYQPPHDHPMIHFNGRAVGNVVDFFDITLTEGKLASVSQSWFIKQLGTGISMIAFFVFITAFGLVLLKTAYFGAIIQAEPQGLTTVTDGKSRLRYIIIFIIGLIPAPLLYNWAVGYSIDILASGRAVKILMPASPAFPLPCVNGIFVLNFLTGIITVVLYLFVFKVFAKKAGCTFENMGIKLSGKGIFRAAVLAVCVFAAGYFMLTLCDYFFKTDFRFFTLSIKTLTPSKWAIYLRYLPSFLFFFLVSAMSQNTFTRINNQKEGINILLIVIASFGGLLVLHLIDYIALMNTGVKVFQFIPFTDGKITAALAGVLLWGLLFILPVAALISRIFFRATGSIWAGAFINALVVTLFAMSNTVVAARVI
ncbi:MAG: alpha/beta fold hydrolase [Spirochaetaceae bacterium]|jgi:pimeloyl-ACP methyl ester carboxylesterase|nr:alpha/beta fold hydrolase [Spirochaetaceae bacterium]